MIALLDATAPGGNDRHNDRNVHDLITQAKVSGSKPSFEQMHALHAQLQQETIQKLTPVLSDTQLKKFEILMEDMGPRHGFEGHGHPQSDAN